MVGSEPSSFGGQQVLVDGIAGQGPLEPLVLGGGVVVEQDVVHSQGCDVVDLLDDAAQVAHAIAGGVAKGLGTDLVDDTVRQ